MHARAVGALEVVEVDDGDFGSGVAADGAAGDVDVGARILGEVEGFKAGELLAVGGDEEVDDLGMVAVGEGDGQFVITADRAWLAGAEDDVVVLRDVELGADRDLDAPVEHRDR